MAINIKEVAAEAGMSVSSVSRILNRTPGYTFNQASQIRVREAAEKLGYHPSVAAQLLRRREKTIVGLASHLSEHPHANRLLVAVRNELFERGYEPVLMEPSQLAGTGIGGVADRTFPGTDLLVGVLTFGFAVGDEGLAYCLDMHRKVPLVALHPLPTNKINWFYTDHQRGIAMLVDHLVALGHRRIELALSSKSPYYSEQLKLQGWKKAIAKYKLKSIMPGQIELLPNDSMKERAGRIEEFLLSMNPRPTAVICGGDESALSLMARLQKRGWNIPRDLSIAGYDGIDFGEYVWPQLTSVLQPVQQIARLSVDRLLQLAKTSDPPRQMLLAPTLLARTSTAALVDQEDNRRSL